MLIIVKECLGMLKNVKNERKCNKFLRNVKNEKKFKKDINCKSFSKNI